jgi:hypothetical protein
LSIVALKSIYQLIHLNNRSKMVFGKTASTIHSYQSPFPLPNPSRIYIMILDSRFRGNDE